MNKPETVKLEVFKFNLSPKKAYKDSNGTITFRDLFMKNLGSPDTISNTELFTLFFNHFITSLDTEYKRVKNKAFTLINENNQTGFNTAGNIIYGVLEGGPLGEGKTRRRFTNKHDGNSLDGNVINDKYFFYIYSPLNHDTGYLMFQIYQQDSIRWEFINFIFKNVFKYEQDYNMPNYDPFIPQSIKDEFRHSSKVKELKFSETLLSRQIDETASFVDINDSYKIEVRITPIRSTFGTQVLETVLPPFLRKTFNNIFLNDFDKKKITLQNRQTKRDATFELDGTGDIMPRIYLLNRIAISQYGIPNFDELKIYCDQLLHDIINEEPGVIDV